MRNKLIYGLLILILALSCGKKTEKGYNDADAVYQNLTKTFILNEDGSMDQTIEKKIKLLTHKAFHSLYGETRISYNPSFQNVEIGKAYTVNASRQRIDVPENGIIEVLPDFCADTKAYNSIREKVIVHTGLECDAVINCSYSVKTKAGIFPGLSGIETIPTDCPIEKLRIVVKIPSRIKLNYKLINSAIQPVEKEEGLFKTYTWDFSDVPQHLSERNEPVENPEIPVLAFSALKDTPSFKHWIASQSAFFTDISDTIRQYIRNSAEQPTPLLKALKAQEIVVNEINTLRIPGRLTAFRMRSPNETWRSNSGTSFEKCNLLTSILRSQGFQTEICLQYPSFLDQDNLPFIFQSEPFVRTVAGSDTLFLSATHLNPNSAEFRKYQTVISSLQSDFKVKNNSINGSAIQVTGKMSLDKSGMITGILNASFSGPSLPYYNLSGKKDNYMKLLPGIDGKIERLTAQRADVTFKAATKNWVVKRGDYTFIELPESKLGLNSLGIKPLPLSRKSPLVLYGPIKESYQYTLVVPQQSSLINSGKFARSNEVGSVSFEIGQTGKEIVLSRSVEIKKMLITKEEYARFKELADEWDSKKGQQLILKNEN